MGWCRCGVGCVCDCLTGGFVVSSFRLGKREETWEEELRSAGPITAPLGPMACWLSECLILSPSRFNVRFNFSPFHIHLDTRCHCCTTTIPVLGIQYTSILGLDISSETESLTRLSNACKSVSENHDTETSSRLAPAWPPAKRTPQTPPRQSSVKSRVDSDPISPPFPRRAQC